MPASVSKPMTAAIDSVTSIASTCTSGERDAGDVDADDSSRRSGGRALSFDDAGASSAARKYAATIGFVVIDPADAPDRVGVGCRAIWRKARASAGVA